MQDKKCKQDLAEIAATSTLTPFRFNVQVLPVKYLRGYQEKKTERFLQEHAFRSKEQRGKRRVEHFVTARDKLFQN